LSGEVQAKGGTKM